jgi:uncharacterized protein (TIGR02145 family)
MKRIIVLIFTIVICFQWTVSQNIVAYYPFNGNANDESGNNRHPTYNGATLTTDRFGNNNSAYNFSGLTNGHIEYSSTGLPETNRTISFWFNAIDLSSKPVLFSYGGNGCATSLLMAVNSSASGNYPSPQYLVTGHCNTNNINYIYDAEPVNEWYHWVLTIHGNEQKLYINGELKSTQNTFTGNTYTTERELALGVATYISGFAPYTDTNLGYFQGKLDDIRIYDAALSDNQVTQLFEDESSGLVGLYPLNGNADDESFFQNHGIINSATEVSDRFGNTTSAYGFDGNDDYISIPDRFQNRLTSKLTISTWAKRTRYGIDLILEKGGDWTTGTCNYGMGLHYVNNNMFYFFYNGGWRGANGVNDFNWHHYAVVAENGWSEPKLYIDGILKSVIYGEGSPTISLYPSTHDIHVGAQIGTLSYYGANEIDLIKIYNRLMTDDEIYAMYIDEATCSDPLHAVVSSSENSGPGTLRAAIGCVNSGGTITWSPVTNRALLTESLTIQKNIQITGPDPNNNPEIIVDFAEATSGLIFENNSILNLTNVDFKIRNHSENKPLTEGSGTLTVAGVTIVKHDQYPFGVIHCNPVFATDIVDVTNPITGKTWMDRNLGAKRVATSSFDTEAYGDLYQWGRFADGHQCRSSSTTNSTSNSDNVGHGNFILPPSGPFDWRSPQNPDLWQGENGVNNPCPCGYRLPTIEEWQAERNSWGTGNYNANGAFNSPLKLPMAGYRFYGDGSINPTITGYWSSTVGNPYTNYLEITNGYANVINSNRALGFSVRCIKE